MTGRVHRSRGDPDPDELPPLHYGHKMRADHIILGSDLTKGAGGEQACLICLDEFSGVIGAFCMTQRSIDNNIIALQKFAGSKASSRSLCQVKTDCAQELTNAVEHLGWLSDSGIENDPLHNAKLESLIRRIKEGTRAIHLKSGLPHSFWPRSIEYFCVAHAITTPCSVHPNETDEAKKLKEGKTAYEVAVGEPFVGYRIPFGALVWYKPPKHRELPAFDPRTFPGIFCGWRLDNASKFRGVHLVLDYEAIRTNKKGCDKPFQVYQTELVMPEVFVFPLEEASNTQLALFRSDLELPTFEPREALPFEEGAPEPVKRKRRTYVTLDRVIRFGRTVGCKGCERMTEGVRHLDECHARIERLLEEEKVAREALKSRMEKSAKESHPSAHEVSGLGVEPRPSTLHLQEQRCESKHLAPHTKKLEAQKVGGENDYWEFDETKKAWKRVHVRPRKRLFTPVGNDCPFEPHEVHSKRETLWTQRGKTSTYGDDWQAMSPNRRISSRSWLGATFFFPKEYPKDVKARIIHMTCNSVKEPNQGLDAVVSILGMNPVPAVIKEEQTLTPPRERRMRANKPPVMFEFCCSKDSRLGEVNTSRGFQHFRLCKEFTDLSDPLQIESLSSMIDQFKGADLWGSVPFGPWFQQKLAFNRHGKAYRSKLRKRLQESRTLLKNFLAIAELIILNGGHVCLEWPKLCEGWATKELLVFVKRHNLYETCCDGRALGLGDESWRIVTSSRKLAKDLSSFA